MPTAAQDKLPTPGEAATVQHRPGILACSAAVRPQLAALLVRPTLGREGHVLSLQNRAVVGLMNRELLRVSQASPRSATCNSTAQGCRSWSGLLLRRTVATISIY